MSRLWWIACLGLATPASAATFVIHSGEKSKVEFESKAAMESFTGHTRSVTGTVELNPAQLGDSLDAHVEVDMKTLDTGVGIRNRHMCENHLQTEKYPTAVFEGGVLSQLSSKSLVEGQSVTGSLCGTMTLHGVQKRLTAPVTLTLRDGALHVVAKFPVTLADYSIPRPQMLVMKLGETQKVTVDLVARPK